MSLKTEINDVKKFIKDIFYRANKTHAVVAVSGGIDSAVSLSLVVKALGKENVHPVFLPYDQQDMSDAKKIADFWQIPVKNRHEYQIKSSVTSLAQVAGIKSEDTLRLGNIMARVRMIFVFDLAKQLDALVVGTENKSEKHLGYFTRFGDEASDLEPLQQWYKTEIRQVAQLLGLPAVFLTKAPSAGLWVDQTDEGELGFSYDQADQVLRQYIDQKLPVSKIKLSETNLKQAKKIVRDVLARVKASKFKLEVPYHL